MSLTRAGELTRKVKEKALGFGFSAVGIASADALSFRNRNLKRWLERGFAAKLTYMEAFFDRQEKLLTHIPDMRSIIVLAVSYANENPLDLPPGTGRIARYAQGKDYHRIVKKRLGQLEGFLRTELVPEKELHTVICVDTHAVQERALAESAGLGFFGKNSCLILRKGGSFFFLAALLTNLELTPDAPISWDCGSCTLCLQACPTGALKEPYTLDAGQCISYLTIEHRGKIDPSLRPLMGEWLFGCDICQEVCPYNRKPHPVSPWKEFEPTNGAGAFQESKDLLALQTQEQFEARFAGTPLMRAKREGLLRNAAVVAANRKDPEAIPALKKAAFSDPSPTVREHASWALDKLTE